MSEKLTQRENEVLNTLATMPERSKATILGIRVERIIFGYSVEDGATMHPIGAARAIVQLADARLNAAAPDMLRALEECLFLHEISHEHSLDPTARRLILAAIAKATGR
jgi:hypothetical protein